MEKTTDINYFAMHSPEEYDERRQLLLQAFINNNFELRYGLAFADGGFKPIELLKAFETENPLLNNKKYYNNSVICLKTGIKIPLMKYCRQERLNLYKVALESIVESDRAGYIDDEAVQRLQKCFLKGTVRLVRRYEDI